MCSPGECEGASSGFGLGAKPLRGNKKKITRQLEDIDLRWTELLHCLFRLA